METQDQNFDTFKKTFIEWCKANGACEGEFRKVVVSKDASELLAVIHTNFNWCMSKSLDASSLKVFGDDTLFAAKIIVGDVTGKLLEEGVWCVAQSTVKAYGSSTVEAYDSSTVKAYGSSTVKAYGSSTVEAYDSSTVKAYDSSTVKAYSSSTVKAYSSSTVEAYSSSTVEAYSSSTVKAYDSSTVEAYSSSTVKAWDWAILHIRKSGHKLELGSNWKIEDITILASGETE